MPFSAQGAFATSAYGNSTYDYSNTDGLILGPDDLSGIEFGVQQRPSSNPNEETTKVVSLQEMQKIAREKANKITEIDKQIIFIRGEDDPTKAREIVEAKRNLPIDNNVEFRQSVAALSEKRAYALLNTLTYAKEGDRLIFRPTDNDNNKREILIEALWTLRQGIDKSDPDYPLENVINYASVIDNRYPANPDLGLQNNGIENMLKRMYEQELNKEVRIMISNISTAKEIRNHLLNLNAEKANEKNIRDVFQLLGAIWMVYQDFCEVLQLHSKTPNLEPALKMLGGDLNIIISNYNIQDRRLDFRTKKLYQILIKIAEKYTNQRKESWIAEQKRLMQERRKQGIKKEKPQHKPIKPNDKKTGPIPLETQSRLIKKSTPPLAEGTYIVPDIYGDDEINIENIQKDHSEITSPLNRKPHKPEYTVKREEEFKPPQKKLGLKRTARTAGSHDTVAIGKVTVRDEEESYIVYNPEESIPTYGVPARKATDTPSGSLKMQPKTEYPSVNE